VAKTTAITGTVISVAGQLRDAEEEYRQREQTRAGDPLDQEGNADQQHLNERDADDALSNGPNGGRTQRGHLRPPVGSGYAREDSHRGAASALAEGHEYPGDDQRRDEDEKRRTDSRDCPQQAHAHAFQLRAQLLDQRGQVGGGLQPAVVQALANQRPAGDRFRWWWNVVLVIPDQADRMLHRVRQRHAQEINRRQHGRDGNQHDQRRGAAVTAQFGPEPGV
jgi:hypothetical protein